MNICNRYDELEGQRSLPFFSRKF